MVPKSHVLVVFVLIFAAQATYAQCDNFYSKVTYALSHGKKAMEATNFEHQMYYAERALTALEKSEDFMAECNCDKANKLLNWKAKYTVEDMCKDAWNFHTHCKLKNQISNCFQKKDIKLRDPDA